MLPSSRPSVAFTQPQLKQLRAQCLVFVAFRYTTTQPFQFLDVCIIVGFFLSASVGTSCSPGRCTSRLRSVDALLQHKVRARFERRKLPARRAPVLKPRPLLHGYPCCPYPRCGCRRRRRVTTTTATTLPNMMSSRVWFYPLITRQFAKNHLFDLAMSQEPSCLFSKRICFIIIQ
jgi:hypothetical protein